MSGWLTTLARLAAAVEGGVDAVTEGMRDRLGDRGAPRIVPYIGYGTRERWRISARVLRNTASPASRTEDGPIDHLVAAWRNFETDEVPHARVRISGAGASIETQADEEGHVVSWLSLPQAVAGGWHDVTLSLLQPATSEPVRATGEVMVPGAGTSFLVISDVDDTVIQTGATDTMRMAREVILGSARTRMPFPGVAAFYRALVAGPSGAGENPVFYVSSGPWNLYGQLIELFALRDIPRGPLMLRDWGISATELAPTRHMAHKRGAINEMLVTYPGIPVILIGDSGQQDPEIYASVVREHPGRVLAVYIREVTHRSERVAAIRKLADELQSSGGTLVLVDDSSTAAQHAAAHGWIAESALPGIGAAVASERGPN